MSTVVIVQHLQECFEELCWKLRKSNFQTFFSMKHRAVILSLLRKLACITRQSKISHAQVFTFVLLPLL